MGNKRFVVTYSQGTLGIQIFMDTVTGVQYLTTASVGGLTVLLDEDGKPLIDTHQKMEY